MENHDHDYLIDMEINMQNLTNSAILALHNHATLMQEVYGKITHSQLKSEARNLIDMGIPTDQVDYALFRVENIHNISIEMEEV